MKWALGPGVAVTLLLLPGALPQPGAEEFLQTPAESADSALADMAAEFPQADQPLWLAERHGLLAVRLTRRLAQVPADPETLLLLLEQDRLPDALGVLRRIVQTRPAQIPTALAAIQPEAHRFITDEAHGYAAALGEILALARRRLPGLAKEEAARAAFALASIEWGLMPVDPAVRNERIARLMSDYAGTEAARLAEVDRILSGRIGKAQLDELETFARAHAGTIIGARALFGLGLQLAVNVPASGMEPRGSDPAARFLRVVEIARDLESGAYPSCEWVTRAPTLLTSFFAAAPVYAAGSIDRMLDAQLAFVKAHFVGASGRPAVAIVEDLVTRQMAELYARKGEPVIGVERVLSALEQGQAGHDAAKFMRASFYLSAREGRPAGERAALTRQAIETLTTLHEEADGLYERTSLAALASLQLSEGAVADARDSYQTYLSAYPDSAWTWVAALRVGQCAAALGDWAAADEAYRQVANRFTSLPIASVLGQELGARASEALGNFDEALVEHQRALAEWRRDFGQSYTLPGSPGNPAVGRPAVSEEVVSPEALSDRIAELARTLGEPGGAELERGRRLLQENERRSARTIFEGIVARFPRSPLVPEARYLAHRARLEAALDQIDAARPLTEAADAELDALAQAPFDAAVGAAQVARAAVLWNRGDTTAAEERLRRALDQWHVHQPKATLAPTALERDVADIRALVFRPNGGGVFDGARWNAFTWPARPAPFAIVNPDVRVLLAGGEVARVTVREPLPTATKTLFLASAEIALLDAIVAHVGGTGTRLMNRFFAVRPGHWSGWVFETYPIVTQVEFLDAARRRAAVRVTVGYSGATVLLEKTRGVWRATGLTDHWVT